jgi:hypothetical protein
MAILEIASVGLGAAAFGASIVALRSHIAGERSEMDRTSAMRSNIGKMEFMDFVLWRARDDELAERAAWKTISWSTIGTVCGYLSAYAAGISLGLSPQTSALAAAAILASGLASFLAFNAAKSGRAARAALRKRRSAHEALFGGRSGWARFCEKDDADNALDLEPSRFMWAGSAASGLLASLCLYLIAS